MKLMDMRSIVLNNMPYDTGFMVANGASFSENNHYLRCHYNTDRVPYIIYNEEGTIYTTKNRYFIREKTVGALMLFEDGIRDTGLSDQNKRLAAKRMISAGILNRNEG